MEKTHLVDGSRLSRLGETGTDDDLPGRRLSRTTLENLTKVEVLDLLRLDARLSEGTLDGGDTELNGSSLGELTLEGTDGSAGLSEG